MRLQQSIAIKFCQWQCSWKKKYGEIQKGETTINKVKFSILIAMNTISVKKYIRKVVHIFINTINNTDSGSM